MTVKDLSDEIDIELEQIETLLRELTSLREDVSGRWPTIREKTAAAAFLAQFYNGIENILKRISRFKSIPLPAGDTWHVDLFKRFCSPPHKSLPPLFDESLALAMSSFRQFRHVVHHGYGFQMDWTRMQEGMGNIDDVFGRFKARLHDFLHLLEKETK